MSMDSSSPKKNRMSMAVITAGLTLFVLFQILISTNSIDKNTVLTAISSPAGNKLPVPYIALTEKGWNDPIVLLNNKGEVLNSGVPFHPGRYVGFALANSSGRGASNFNYSLKFDGKDIYSQSVQKMLSGEAEIKTIGLDEVVYNNRLRSGRHTIELVVRPLKPGGAPDKSGKSFSVDMDLAVARAPALRKAPQFPAAASIQDLADNYTWITSSNINEVVAIAKEVLRDVPLNWSGINFTVLPFGEYNAKHGEVLGNTAGEKSQITEQVANYFLGGAGFHYFPTSSHQRSHVVLREGLLVQVLPVLIREAGGIYSVQHTYGKKNYEWVFKERASYSPEFDLAILMAYGIRILEERYDWNYITNVSYLNLRDPVGPGYLQTGETWDLWAAATNAGYSEGNIPSDFWLKLHTEILRMADPTIYINSVVASGKALDREKIARLVESRVVDQEPKMISGSVGKKIDPGNKYGNSLSLDQVIVSQMQYVMP